MPRYLTRFSVASVASLGRSMWALPAFMLAVVIGLTVMIWHLERINGRAQAQSEATYFAGRLATRGERDLGGAVRAVRWRWEAGRFATESAFVAEVKDVGSWGPAIATIAWVDPQGVCRQVQGQAAPFAPWQKLGPPWSELVARAQTKREAAGSPESGSKFGPLLDVALPGIDGKSVGSQGAVIYQLRLSMALRDLMDPSFEGRFILELTDQGQTVYRVPARSSPTDAAVVDLPPASMQVLDRTWQLNLAPTKAFVDQHVDKAPNWALWTWLAGLVLFVASVWQGYQLRFQNDRRVQQQLNALEKLAETSAVVLSKVGSTGEVWPRLAEAARELMSMSMSAVAVLDEQRRSLQFVVDAGVQPSLKGREFPLDKLPTTKRCMDGRRPIAMPDLDRITVPMNRALTDPYGLRSMLEVPLLVGQKTIGVMILGQQKVRDFSAEDIRLAELWGMLAAVAIANDRMYEQAGQALASRNRLLEQRDALFAVINNLVAQYGSMDQILQGIVQFAPVPLEMDLCQVGLASENPNELVLAAMTKDYAPDLVGTRYPIEGSQSGRAFRERRVIVVENGGPDNPTLYAPFRKRLPCGSLLFVPMMGAGVNPIGLLTFTRVKSGSFSPEQISLSQLLAVRAAMAIENSRLYQRTRADADARATLLRELNHRVKNNLAGIVALLSINQPDMPPKARKWLNRVGDRVRTLARAHDMLSGSPERVSLKELVDQTLHSLAVVTPPGAAVRTELCQGDVLVRTDRAVTLAMVLHELCYNALVHGLGESAPLKSGTLLVRAAAGGPNTLIIEVIDDGGGFDSFDQTQSWSSPPEPASPPGGPGELPADRLAVIRQSRHGLGLNLVSDFVARELRGQFDVISSPGRGTTARVQFPLLEDESHGRGL